MAGRYSETANSSANPETNVMHSQHERDGLAASRRGDPSRLVDAAARGAPTGGIFVTDRSTASRSGYGDFSPVFFTTHALRDAAPSRSVWNTNSIGFTGAAVNPNFV